MTSGAPRRSEWMPMSMHSRQGTLSLLQRNKLTTSKPHLGILTPRQIQTSQAPPAHHVSFKLQSQVEMSQLSFDSSLQPSLVSKPHTSHRRDLSFKSDSSQRQSNSQSQELVRKQSICRGSSFADRRTIPSIPFDRHSTSKQASHIVSNSPKSATRKQLTHNGRGALQRAKQQAMQAPFKPTTTVYKGKENYSSLLSQGSHNKTSSFSGSLFHNTQPFAQHSESSNAGKPSSASLGTRSVVTQEPEQFAATKASLKFEFQRFVEEKEAFLKKKEEEMLAAITDHAMDLTKGLASTIEQGKSDILTEASKTRFQPDLRSEYMTFHQSKIKEARNQINLDVNRAKEEAIEEIRIEHSSILSALEGEKNHLLDTGKDIIAQAIQAKDAALASINKLHSGTLRSIADYLKNISIGKKAAQSNRDEFSQTFVSTPRKKRSPYSKPMSSEKSQFQATETCSNSESALDDKMSQDLMKKRRRVSVSKSKDPRKRPLREPSNKPADNDGASNLLVIPQESEPQCSPFKLVSPSSTAMKKSVPVVSTRKQKRFPRHFQGRSKRARTHASNSQPLDFKDDVTFSFRCK